MRLHHYPSLRPLLTVLLCGHLGLGAIACGEDDPEPSHPGTNNTTNTTTTSPPDEALSCAHACETLAACDDAVATRCAASCAASMPGDAILGLSTVSCETALTYFDDFLDLQGSADQRNMCMAAATDYAPGADDTWDACVSDSGEYTPIEPSISSIARVEAFETIAALLWERSGAPSTTDFTNARLAYATDEGLDSRVQRREDEHYPPVTNAQGDTLSCRDAGVPAMAPERCVGPAKLIPILNEAFNKGISGEGEALVHAARIEAALVWFLYVSTHKEATTCAVAPKDCDSAYAYYTGGQTPEQGLGLSRYMRELAPRSNDRAWDGILATRCWRDLDPETPATNLTLRDQAVAQLDGALLHGVSRIVAARLAAAQIHEGVARDADWAFLKILGPVLDRDATTRDAAQAATLRQAFAAASFDAVDVDATLAALTALYPCP